MTGPPDPPAGPDLPIVPPIVEAAWSAEFIAQTLEVFIVGRAGGRGGGADSDGGGLINLRPIHADSLRLAMGVGREPADVVVAAVERYELRPIVVHSTSWRAEPGRIVLSYVAAVVVPDRLSPFLVPEPIGRSDLARGDATAAPAAIGVNQVLEHALRHLSWLVRDDPAVRDALAAWRPELEAYVPEPFRNL